jgi:hypothetical protein
MPGGEQLMSGDDWIRIEDQRPSIGQRVLAWDLTVRAEVIAYFGRGGFYELWRGQYHTLRNISHWMPLPGVPPPARARCEIITESAEVIACAWCGDGGSPLWNCCPMCGHELGKEKNDCGCTRCRTAESRRQASLN